MMQTRHSAPRPSLQLAPSSSTSLSLLTSDLEATSDLLSLLTPAPLPPTPPSDNVPDHKSDQSRKRPLSTKQTRLLDGILGLASMVVETEGVDAEGEIPPETKEEEPKGKRKVAKVSKDSLRKKHRGARGNGGKTGRNGQSKSHHKAKTSHEKTAIQYAPYCKLSNNLGYLPAASSQTIVQSWDLFMQSIPSQLLPTSQTAQVPAGSSLEVRSEKSRKSTIHVAIAFFIRGDMQEKKSEVQD